MKGIRVHCSICRLPIKGENETSSAFQLILRLTYFQVFLTFVPCVHMFHISSAGGLAKIHSVRADVDAFVRREMTINDLSLLLLDRHDKSLSTRYRAIMNFLL